MRKGREEGRKEGRKEMTDGDNAVNALSPLPRDSTPLHAPDKTTLRCDAGDRCLPPT